MNEMQFSGMRNGGVHEAVEDEEQALCLALGVLGKGLDNEIIRAIRSLLDPFGNISLLDLVLNLES